LASKQAMGKGAGIFAHTLHVIPAKAGIHSLNNLWMPACAGMTDTLYWVFRQIADQKYDDSGV
jgi:hypothetical protein